MVFKSRNRQVLTGNILAVLLLFCPVKTEAKKEVAAAAADQQHARTAEDQWNADLTDVVDCFIDVDMDIANWRGSG